jgi:hypothetical protein
MFSIPKRLAIFSLLVLTLLLSACNMPNGEPTESGAGLIFTAAAQTVQAQLTQVSGPPATAAPTPSGLPTSAAGQTPAVPPSPTLGQATGQPPAATPVPPSPTPIPCDRAKFVKDVTIPDNSEVTAGAGFVKTWQLQNDGSCTWTTGYSVVFTGGTAMGAPASLALPASVAPGATVDITLSLTAPQDGGTYKAEFKLRNAANNVFGLGNDAKTFWVQVKVPVESGLLLDFLVQADESAWKSSLSSASSEGEGTLEFNGADDDPNGVAKIKDGVKLENNATSGKILLMVPAHGDEGMISGTYPAYTVQSGDHLKARVGFMLPSGGCGSAKVRFQVAYKDPDSSEVKLLWESNKSCTGSLMPVDIDLSTLKGRSVQLILVVKAEGSITGDWAIWNSPRIEH